MEKDGVNVAQNERIKELIVIKMHKVLQRIMTTINQIRFINEKRDASKYMIPIKDNNARIENLFMSTQLLLNVIINTKKICPKSEECEKQIKKQIKWMLKIKYYCKDIEEEVFEMGQSLKIF